jgi:large subunit ribosomal protein L15
MQKHQLKRKNKNKKSIQIGRGGKRGKTSGKGHKGQKSRAGAKIRPAARDIIKKLPKLRGRGKNSFKAFKGKPFVVNLSVLEKAFESGDIVTPSTLSKKGIVLVKKGILPRVKILGTGNLTKKIAVMHCTISKSAQEVIEKTGGSVK